MKTNKLTKKEIKYLSELIVASIIAGEGDKLLKLLEVKKH